MRIVRIVTALLYASLFVASMATPSWANCISLLKQVSVDGGQTWFDADTVGEAPAQAVGGPVAYRLIVGNCNKVPFSYQNVRITDPTLGIDFTLPGVLETGASIVITSANPGFSNLHQPGRCATAGPKPNTATVAGQAVQYPGTINTASDPAWVDCVPPPPASLGDRVWEDLDGDGEQDAGEPGIPGAPVELSSPGADGACGTPDDAFLANSATGADGFYLFADLLAGDYCVSFPEDPNSALDCGPNSTASYTVKNASGVSSVDDSNAYPDGTTDSVALAAGDEDLTIDAGLFCSASLGDTLWNDSDADGLQDGLNQAGGEPGLNGFAVTLMDCDGDIVGTPTTTGPAPVGAEAPQTTGGAGWYQFTGLTPGCYTVAFDAPAGASFSPANQGGADDLDSDVNPNGVSGPVLLSSGDSNQTVDAGVNQPLAGLGDFVFEDDNANGIQDPGEPGIENVPVRLLTPGADGVCNTPDDADAGRSTTTDGTGMYQFLDLGAGDYCVEFDASVVDCQNGPFDLGTPTISAPGQGGDPAADSNPDPDTGVTGNVSLAPGDFDPTIDAGIYCPAKIGDRVWEDTNGNGLQDGGESNVGGASVELVDCGPDGIAGTVDDVETGETRVTDPSDGMYMFGAEPGFELTPGRYFLRFTDPEGRDFTMPGGSPSDLNSDCSASGRTMCSSIASGDVDLTIDCGVLPPPAPTCDLRINKTCRVEPVPTPMSGAQCSGRIQEFTLIWNGSGPVNLAGVDGVVPSRTSVSPGEAVTFNASASGSNDVFVDISGAVGGRSVFHRSCSDDDMDADTSSNDVQQQVSAVGRDCGKFQGNGKSNGSEFINQWLLDGLVDGDGEVLECTPPEPGGFSESCEFESSLAAVSCETNGRPSSLTFRYLGEGAVAGCTDNAASRANQKPPVCSGNLSVGATVTASTDRGSVSGATVAPGELFTISGFGSETRLTLTGAGGSETDVFHTSCSAPLETGDVFGNAELIAMDGQSGLTSVTYQYEVENVGDPLSDVSVSDDLLGTIGLISSLPDASGSDSAILTAMTSLNQTTTNTASAQGLLADGSICSAPPDSVTVTAVAPTCNVTLTLREVKDDEIKFYVSNTSGITATLDSLGLVFPSPLGAIKEVVLDGAIFKSKDSDRYPSGVPSGVVIEASDWTESNVAKRQLDAGETRELKFKFNSKDNRKLADEFEASVNFAEGCSASF